MGEAAITAGVKSTHTLPEPLLLANMLPTFPAIVTQVAQWALLDPEAVEGGTRRRVLLNPSLRFSKRLFAPLGTSLWIGKINAPLDDLLRRPSTFSPGHVRPECLNALRHIGALVAAVWARQVHDSAAWPTAEHLSLLDKRFGGELTRADVLGVEADDEELPDEVALMKGGTTIAGSYAGDSDAAGSAAGGTHSVGGTTSKRGKYGSRVHKQEVKRRWRPQRLLQLDTANKEFDLRHAEAAAMRAGRSLAVRYLH
jgi:hypothetical protein